MYKRQPQETRAYLGMLGFRIVIDRHGDVQRIDTVSYTHLRAHETELDLVCRLLIEKTKTHTHTTHILLIDATTQPPTHDYHTNFYT